MKTKLNTPKFKNEAEERNYWEKFDLSKNLRKEDFEKISFPNLKPTSRPISIRLPEYLINRLKEQANEINIPYQSLIKNYLKKAVFNE